MTDADDLERLVRWYATAWLEEIDGIEQLHEGVGPAGAPAWSGPLRRHLLTPVDATDDGGWYTRPLRAALLAVARADHDHYLALRMLRETWDPEVLPAERLLPALRHLRRLWSWRPNAY